MSGTDAESLSYLLKEYPYSKEDHIDYLKRVIKPEYWPEEWRETKSDG